MIEKIATDLSLDNGARRPARKTLKATEQTRPSPKPPRPSPSRLLPSARAAAAIRPTAIHAYPDKAAFWVPDEMSPAEIRRLPDGDRLYPDPAEPDPYGKLWSMGLRQRFDAYQPTPALLRALARRRHHLNYAELSNDLIFASEVEKVEAFDTIAQYFVKKYRRRRKNHRDENDDLAPSVRIVRGDKGVTLYSDDPSARTNFVLYRDLTCRLTGETECLHMEMRITGPDALRRAGISNLGDLVEFGHRAFWKKRFELADIDVKKLGRLHRRYVDRPRRVINTTRRFKYDRDRSLGYFIRNAIGSTQNVIDHFAGVLPVRECLTLLNVDRLLPP
jgi:hypothetical protein